jgi:hypothetical protein
VPSGLLMAAAHVTQVTDLNSTVGGNVAPETSSLLVLSRLHLKRRF